MSERKTPDWLNEHTRELVKIGKWTCEETVAGWIIRTEPYSRCCNPGGQSIYTFAKDGFPIDTEHGVGKPVSPSAKDPQGEGEP